MRRLLPVFVLLLLSPAIGELLSGSSPPAEFFQPLAFLMLVVLYGGGATLVRELAVRWEGGWCRILILAAAYGVAEEALICKSFFDPAWPDLGPLAVYGRWLGVNWIWAAQLTVFHAVFSIAIPIALVQLLFPGCRGRPWLRRRHLLALGALWLLNAVLIFTFISSYRPPLAQLLGASLFLAGLIVTARVFPQPRSAGSIPLEQARPFWFALVGFIGTVALFVPVWIASNTTLSPLVALCFIPTLVALVVWGIWRLSARRWSLDPGRQLALIAGSLGFFLLLAPLQQLDRTRTDDTSGMGLVGLAGAVGLFWLSRRLHATAVLVPPCSSADGGDDQRPTSLDLADDHKT